MAPMPIGWPGGHTFGNLVGSDHAQFYGYNANGTKVLDFKLDYITANPGHRRRRTIRRSASPVARAG